MKEDLPGGEHVNAGNDNGIEGCLSPCSGQVFLQLGQVSAFDDIGLGALGGLRGLG